MFNILVPESGREKWMLHCMLCSQKSKHLSRSAISEIVQSWKNIYLTLLLQEVNAVPHLSETALQAS